MTYKNCKEFYYKDLSEIIEQYYHGDIERFSIQLTEEFDKELIRLKQNNKDRKLVKRANIIRGESENYYQFENKNLLTEKLEKRIYKEIGIIKKMQNANGNKLYNKEDAFALIFGEEYI